MLTCRSWQIRLLVKTVKLLGKIEPQPLAQATSSNTPPDARKERQRQYREAVIHCLREACRWISHFASRLTKGGLLRNPRLGILASDVTEDSMTRCDFTPAPDMRTNSQGETEHLACQWTRTREQKYYCAMALWYVLKELPAEVFGFNGDKVNGVSPDDTKAVKTDACPAPAAHTSILWESVKPLSLIRSRDNSGLMAIGEPANCMVRWYHSFCVEQILQRLESEDAAKFQKLEIDRAALALDADKWQKRAEKAMRLFYQGRLSGRLLGHEPANLARVGVEMGTGLKALTAPAAVRGCGRGGVTCLQMAQDLVRQRPATTKPNAGRASVLRWDPSPTHRKIRSAAPRPAPWELSCLAQHLPLNLWTAAEVATIPPGSAGHREALERDRERASDAVREFMLSDYAFAASWDASKSTVVGMWWDFATSCVVAARLVDDELDAAEAAAAIDDTTIAAAGTTSSTAAASSSVTDANPMADRQTRSVVAPSHPPSCPASRMGSRAGVETARDTSGLAIQLPVDSTADWSYVLAAIQAAAFVPRSIDGESDGRFDWKLSRPPELYHSESGVQSLEDTPSVYTIVRQGQSEEGRRSHDTQTPANNGDSRYTSSVHSTVKQGQSKESRRSHDMQTPANNGNSRYTPSVSNTVRQEQSKADRRSHDGQTPANNGDPRRDINLCYNVSNYIKHHALPDLDWTLDSIHKRIPASKLRHLSCFDLVLMNDVNDLPELSDPIINGRANRAFWSNWVNGDKKTRSGVHEAFTTHPGLMDLYLIGKARDYPGIEDSELTDAQKELLYKGNDSQDIRVKLLDDYQESCFDVLNDSVGDPIYSVAV